MLNMARVNPKNWNPYFHKHEDPAQFIPSRCKIISTDTSGEATFLATNTNSGHKVNSGNVNTEIRIKRFMDESLCGFGVLTITRFAPMHFKKTCALKGINNLFMFTSSDTIIRQKNEQKKPRNVTKHSGKNVSFSQGLKYNGKALWFMEPGGSLSFPKTLFGRELQKNFCKTSASLPTVGTLRFVQNVTGSSADQNSPGTHRLRSFIDLSHGTTISQRLFSSLSPSYEAFGLTVSLT